MSARTAERMKARLADALWDCLAELPVGEISVGDVIEAAGVSRGSFYYHFDDLDELLAWAIRQEVMNSDRKGHSFALLLARAEPSGNALVQRAIARVCLLLDKGGMSPVFDVALDAMREVWVAALEPEGGRLPDGVVAQLEYAVGGSVGMLARASRSTEAKLRASSAFIRACNRTLVERIADELGVSAAELVARLERVGGA